jgi:hypothetical protein
MKSTELPDVWDLPVTAAVAMANRNCQRVDRLYPENREYGKSRDDVKENTALFASGGSVNQMLAISVRDRMKEKYNDFENICNCHAKEPNPPPWYVVHKNAMLTYCSAANSLVYATDNKQINQQKRNPTNHKITVNEEVKKGLDHVLSCFKV